VLTAHDDLHTAGAHACARVGVDSDHMARQGRRYGTYAMAAGMLQGLQALSPRQWPPLGAFIKLPALRVVHDYNVQGYAVLAINEGFWHTVGVPPRRAWLGGHDCAKSRASINVPAPAVRQGL
jgi:hypothetical protein